MSNEEIQNLLRTAIQAARSGNKMVARGILEQVIDQEPDNEVAWLWLASVVDDTSERRAALERVLAIDPNNERAQQALASLRQSEPGPEPELATSTPTSPPRQSPPPPMPPRPTGRQMRTPPLGEVGGGRRQTQGRGLSPIMFLLVALVAFGMIALAIYLQVSDQNTTDETTTPTGPSPAQVNANATQTAFAGLFTPTPSLTPPPFTPLPTSLSTATPTATNTPTPTSTPLPLTNFELLVSGKRASATQWNLYAMMADGSQERGIALTAPASDPPLALLEVYDAAYSPDGSQLAFTARFSEDGVSSFEELCVAPAAGGDIDCLTELRSPHVESASWSPDASRIVFASDQDGDYEIFIADAQTGSLTKLTENDSEDRDPAWSPTGDVIAYASDFGQPGTLEIWRMNANGTGQDQLTDNQNSSFAPAWSPDGAQIAFVSDRRVTADLYVMTADGLGESAVFVRDVAASEQHPSWSPNGYWLAFTSDRESAVFDVFVVRPDGTELERITMGEGDSGYVVWKP